MRDINSDGHGHDGNTNHVCVITSNVDFGWVLEKCKFACAREREREEVSGGGGQKQARVTQTTLTASTLQYDSDIKTSLIPQTANSEYVLRSFSKLDVFSNHTTKTNIKHRLARWQQHNTFTPVNLTCLTSYLEALFRWTAVHPLRFRHKLLGVIPPVHETVDYHSSANCTNITVTAVARFYKQHWTSNPSGLTLTILVGTCGRAAVAKVGCIPEAHSLQRKIQDSKEEAAV